MDDFYRGDTYADLAAYFRAVRIFIECPYEPPGRAREEAIAAAKQTKYGHSVEERLIRLARKDAEEWARLLVAAAKDARSDDFTRLQELSPFQGKRLLLLEFGSGFVHLGVLEQVLSSVLETRGLPTMDCDHYVLVVPPEILPLIKVVWIKEGYGSETNRETLHEQHRRTYDEIK